jgi:hypothetical protein
VSGKGSEERRETTYGKVSGGDQVEETAWSSDECVASLSENLKLLDLASTCKVGRERGRQGRISPASHEAAKGVEKEGQDAPP